MKTSTFLLKIIILLVVFCTACSSKDDELANILSKEIQFIGTWKPVEFISYCTSSENDYKESFTDCEQNSRLIVKSDGTFSQSYFYEYNNVCEDDGTSIATWKIENEKLFVTEDGSEEVEVTYFEIIGNVLRVGQYNDDFCDTESVSSDDKKSYYFVEYKRI